MLCNEIVAICDTRIFGLFRAGSGVAAIGPFCSWRVSQTAIKPGFSLIVSAIIPRRHRSEVIGQTFRQQRSFTPGYLYIIWRLSAPVKSVIGRRTAVNVQEIHDDGACQTTMDDVQCLLYLLCQPSLFQFSDI